MKPLMLLGIFLIVVGIIAFTYQGITYTTREKVADIGSMHITTEKKNTIPLSPIVGVLAVVGGALVLVVGRKGA
jgi:drug/metabolite transporter (DMT)-like permease